MTIAPTIREIVASDWIDAAWALLEAHREELTVHKSVSTLKPDRDAYRDLEVRGKMLSLGVFQGETLVGYSINVFGPNLHYSDMVVVNNDLLFLTPDLRQGYLGLALIRATESCARKIGEDMGRPVVVAWHCKDGSAFQRLLQKRNYALQDLIFTKVVHEPEAA